jgi:hypothetical protein
MPGSEPTPIDDDQVRRLVQALRSVGTAELGPLLEATGADTIAAMTQSQFIRGMSWLQRKRAQLKSGQAEAEA